MSIMNFNFNKKVQLLDLGIILVATTHLLQGYRTAIDGFCDVALEQRD